MFTGLIDRRRSTGVRRSDVAGLIARHEIDGPTRRLLSVSGTLFRSTMAGGFTDRSAYESPNQLKTEYAPALAA